MWHIHTDEEQSRFTDRELLSRHSDICCDDDCTGHDELSDDQVTAAVDCLNQYAQEDDTGYVLTDTTCEICLSEAEYEQIDSYVERVDIPQDDDCFLESSLFPWIDDDHGDVE